MNALSVVLSEVISNYLSWVLIDYMVFRVSMIYLFSSIKSWLGKSMSSASSKTRKFYGFSLLWLLAISWSLNSEKHVENWMKKCPCSMWEFLWAYLKYQLLKSRQRWRLKAWKFVLELSHLNFGISATFCILLVLKSPWLYWILIGEYVINEWLI